MSFAAQNLSGRAVKYEVYETRQVKGNDNVTEFYSYGRNGAIRKRVIFRQTEIEDVFTLGFGSVDDNGEINDMSITNNGDTDKILATIHDIITNYTNKYPERLIYFEGSTPSRTRLYRKAIGLNAEQLSEEFLILGYYNDRFVLFVKNMNASAFLIKRK